jgi:hypothetical protein
LKVDLDAGEKEALVWEPCSRQGGVAENAEEPSLAKRTAREEQEINPKETRSSN